jgi:hypothetical protein
MKTLTLIFCACALNMAAAQELDELWFRPTDTLAPRDEYGFLHQGKVVYSTDFAPRYHWRPLYYLESGRDLVRQPAYMGAVQTALRRLGYYCGPTDGIFSDDVSDALARFQKNHSMRVTGTLTIPVRRALFLP